MPLRRRYTLRATLAAGFFHAPQDRPLHRFWAIQPENRTSLPILMTILLETIPPFVAVCQENLGSSPQRLVIGMRKHAAIPIDERGVGRSGLRGSPRMPSRLPRLPRARNQDDP